MYKFGIFHIFVAAKQTPRTSIKPFGRAPNTILMRESDNKQSLIEIGQGKKWPEQIAKNRLHEKTHL